MFDCLGSPSTTETAKCSSVLPAAHAAAADQQCPTPQLGCCATGNQNYDKKMQTAQKYGTQKHYNLSLLFFSLNQATLAASRQSNTPSNSMSQATTTVSFFL